MKKESNYVRVPTWMVIVYLIFYYLSHYLVFTNINVSLKSGH